MFCEENLVIKELGDVVIEARDHTVALLVPVEVLNIRMINDIIETNCVTNDDDKDDADYIAQSHIDPEGRKLRFATPLGKVNILKNVKSQHTGELLSCI